MSSFLTEVSDPARLHAQIHRLASRARGRRLASLAQEGAPFARLVTERDELVPLLSRALADASFRPGPARLVHAFLAGRDREIARIGALDHVVHGVVAEVLGERLEPRYSPSLFSYRRARSSWQALRWLGGVARSYARAEPDPRRRQLFVLRADVRRYAESIPLDDASPLWAQLREASGLRGGEPAWEMLRALFRVDVRDTEGAPLARDRGTLFGAPTTNLACNLYLMPLDEALGAPRPAARGGYARFGDDVLFVSPDAGEVRAAHATLLTVLEDLRLEVNPTKLRLLAWNGAARPAEAWPEAEPVDRVSFLGADVRWTGTVALPTPKWRRTVRDVRGRILRTAAALAPSSPEERARTLAAIANEALGATSEVSVDAGVMLAGLVDDRAQLAELDRLLALWIAEAATGERGPRALRRMSPRWLRAEAGLLSRVVARNRG